MKFLLFPVVFTLAMMVSGCVSVEPVEPEQSTLLCTTPEAVADDLASRFPDATVVSRDEDDGVLFIAWAAPGETEHLIFAYLDTDGRWCLATYFTAEPKANIGEAV